MGSGIAQVAAASGDRVRLFDSNPSAAALAVKRIGTSLSRAEEKGYVTSKQREITLSNLSIQKYLEPMSDIQVVVEAVKEDLAIKKNVFRTLEGLLNPEAFLWTNTSMLPISALAGDLARPAQLLGVHFFNPVPRMKLVEIIPGNATSSTAVRFAKDSVTRWGKTFVLAPDSPGFIVNRVFDAIKREALDLLNENVPADQIDTALRLGLNFPMGPFELMDLIGLDTTHDVAINQAKAMGRPWDFPQLARLVKERKLGRKTGQGFYSYPGEEKSL